MLPKSQHDLLVYALTDAMRNSNYNDHETIIQLSKPETLHGKMNRLVHDLSRCMSLELLGIKDQKAKKKSNKREGGGSTHLLDIDNENIGKIP
ncbi:unnamed protein product [Protopolystoma xenopodis]|uniref:Uncharacterized protein n=1 Tax=Protopolystoma xenopodis TaxID=117903 RepID=A0A448WI10_9PLAT|nr:unnamed protein product [Protopolystoma xenopodis]